MKQTLAIAIIVAGTTVLWMLFRATYRDWQRPDRSGRGLLRRLGRRFAVVGLGIMLANSALYLALAAEAPDRHIWDRALQNGEPVTARVVAIREPFLSCFGKPCVPTQAIRVVAADGGVLFEDLWLDHGQRVEPGQALDARQLDDSVALPGLEPFQLSSLVSPTLSLFAGLGALFAVIGASMLLGEWRSRPGGGASIPGNGST